MYRDKGCIGSRAYRKRSRGRYVLTSAIGSTLNIECVRGEENMTEAEAFEAVMLASDNAMTAYSIYLTVLFAYMTVAYLAGKNLTSFQMVAASGMFIVASLTCMASAHLYIHAWGVITREFPGGISALEGSFWNEPLFLTVLLVTMIVGIVMGLYFMYRVRYPAQNDR
jgi:hypothetical protein